MKNKKRKKTIEHPRDHLFISYATEDLQFVQWLTLKLTAEGYKVWCDRIKLLGGESYPNDIDDAIKTRTFRFLLVLSHNSIKKTNPVKERTLALNLGREREENFVIPLNLDGVSATDLNWMISDLTFIPFNFGWADGLHQLLEQLDKLQAPRTLVDGRTIAANWFEPKQFVVKKPERLWLNLAEVKQLPRDFYRFEALRAVPDDERQKLFVSWPHLNEGSSFWAFSRPPEEFDEKYDFEETQCREDWNILRKNDPALRHIAVRLLNECVRSISLSRGLAQTLDGKHCYFPNELLTNNRLTFDGYDYKSTRIQAVGVRNFNSKEGKEAVRYHLAPQLKIWLDSETGCVFQVRVHLYLTNLQGQQIEGKASLRRRKKICRSWWNYEWLMRTLAVLQFLAGSSNSIQVGESGQQQLIISKYPLTAQIPFSLNENQIGLEKIAPESDEISLDLGDEADDEQGNEDE